MMMPIPNDTHDTVSVHRTSPILTRPGIYANEQSSFCSYTVAAPTVSGITDMSRRGGRCSQ